MNFISSVSLDLITVLVLSLMYFFALGNIRIKVKKQILIQANNFYFNKLVGLVVFLVTILLLVNGYKELKILSDFTLFLVFIIILLNILWGESDAN